MRVLITGVLGFIGSHTADAFLARGDTVLGLDDFSGNVVDAIPGVNVGRFDARRLNALYNPDHVDLVIHAASPVGPVALLERTSIVSEIVETTQSVLRFCERGNVPLVNISTSEVYGFSGEYSETDDCHVPHKLSHRIQYAAGKLAAEHLVRTSNVSAVTIRPFNVAGPRQDRSKGFVLPTFCEQALKGEPLTVFEGGFQQRCLTGVWDIVDFIVRACPIGHGDGVFNVGNPHNRTTVKELAELVKMMSGSKSILSYTSGKAVHGPDYEEAVGFVKVPDISRAQAAGWEPQVSLEDLVQRTLEEVSGGVQVQAA